MPESTNLPPIILLMGPTASGKTELALELVRQLPCEIVSVDSAMVYRHMDIGTAKPSVPLRARVPHRLIDILEPSEAYSAGRFRADARHAIQAITRQGRIPLLVGGTMLYFRALQRGLASLPAADPGIRAEIGRLAGAQGWAAVHAELASIDPVAAGRIHPNDPQRLQRALEVYRLTGQTLSDHLLHEKYHHTDTQPAYRYIKLGLLPATRAGLYQRIEQRFEAMLKLGLINEVSTLYKREDLHAALPSMRTVGYRQVREYLAGRIDYPAMRERAIIATRQLAKRQMTWLRGESGVDFFEAGHSAADDLIAALKTQLER